jgi:uncharacterized protein YcaQ
MPLTPSDLRRHAIASSLFPATTLRRAIDRLGFVQADPIRAPARAQELTLRHRVADYRTGDLDRRYAALHLEEDFLYAYGFMPRSTWELLHPRGQRALSASEQTVLDLVSASKRIHPRELEAHLGRAREVNGWGGYSKTTTRNLERLHYLGLIRVAGRENGIRLYAPTGLAEHQLDPAERLRRLTLMLAAMFQPVSERSLRSALMHVGHYSKPDLPGLRTVIKTLLQSGDLDSAEVDGVRYLWPAGKVRRPEPEATVRFLAPFDPIAFDRRRIEHLWGWTYRFEAYTPPLKRKLGYYAMPLLWRDDLIGWVNITFRDGEIDVDPGFVRAPKATDKTFLRAFEEETERFRFFMTPDTKA